MITYVRKLPHCMITVYSDTLQNNQISPIWLLQNMNREHIHQPSVLGVIWREHSHKRFSSYHLAPSKSVNLFVFAMRSNSNFRHLPHVVIGCSERVTWVFRYLFFAPKMTTELALTQTSNTKMS